MTTFTKLAACATAALMGSTSLVMAQDCADPVKVGVLHSLSGTMAISETTLKDTMLMLIDAQNEKGGVLGCEIEAVVVDPASDWPLFAEKARELLTVNEVEDEPGGEVRFALNIIPHTGEGTTLGDLSEGDTVNLEIDVLARYLKRMQSLAG
mgnify:CR=1 FL=1